MGNTLNRIQTTWKVYAAVFAALLIGVALGGSAAEGSKGDSSSLQADLIRAQEDLLASQQDGSDLLSENQELLSDLESTQGDLDDLQEDYDFTTRNLSKLEAQLEKEAD